MLEGRSAASVVDRRTGGWKNSSGCAFSGASFDTSDSALSIPVSSPMSVGTDSIVPAGSSCRTSPTFLQMWRTILITRPRLDDNFFHWTRECPGSSVQLELHQSKAKPAERTFSGFCCCLSTELFGRRVGLGILRSEAASRPQYAFASRRLPKAASDPLPRPRYTLCSLSTPDPTPPLTKFCISRPEEFVAVPH